MVAFPPRGRIYCACAFYAAIKMADYALAVQCWNHSSLATERFQIRPLKISDLHCPLVVCVSRIVCETNEHWKSEMLSNRHTDRQTHRPNYQSSKVQSSLHCPFGDGIQVNAHVSNVTKDNISVPNPADENNPPVNRARTLSHKENPTTPEAYWWDRALTLSLC